jgi:hypothetical protein
MVVALALLASGCRTDRERTEPEPAPVTQERVEDALLTADDLGASFELSDDSTPISTEPIPEHECDDRVSELEPREAASVDFTGDGTTFTNTVAWFPGGGGAVDQLFRKLVEDCASVVVPDEDLAVRAGGLDFGVLSDDTLAIRIEVEAANGAIQERDLILVRVGDLVSLVRLTGPRPSDKVLLDRVVRIAIGRVGRLADDTT